jgi:hypothetical protein
MTEETEALVLDLLEWIGSEDRSYTETMDAWRTSCPRLPVWEDANDRGFVTRELVSGRAMVRISSAGHEALALGRGNRASARPRG